MLTSAKNAFSTIFCGIFFLFLSSCLTDSAYAQGPEFAYGIAGFSLEGIQFDGGIIEDDFSDGVLTWIPTFGTVIEENDALWLKSPGDQTPFSGVAGITLYRSDAVAPEQFITSKNGDFAAQVKFNGGIEMIDGVYYAMFFVIDPPPTSCLDETPPFLEPCVDTELVMLSLVQLSNPMANAINGALGTDFARGTNVALSRLTIAPNFYSYVTVVQHQSLLLNKKTAEDAPYISLRIAFADETDTMTGWYCLGCDNPNDFLPIGVDIILNDTTWPGGVQAFWGMFGDPMVYTGVPVPASSPSSRAILAIAVFLIGVLYLKRIS